MIVGLTGGIGSGKTTVSNYFQSLGIVVIDADIISREVVEPSESSFHHIVDRFGNKIIDEYGGINRALLRNIIFSQDEDRLWLERLLHPLINKKIKNLLRVKSGQYKVLVSPLLLESEQRNMVNRITVVDSIEEQQIKRVMSRDYVNEKQIKSIMSNQLSKKKRLSYADDIIYNNDSVAFLHKTVYQFHLLYQKLAI